MPSPEGGVDETSAGRKGQGPRLAAVLPLALALGVISACEFEQNFRFLTGAGSGAVDPTSILAASAADSAADPLADLPPPIARDWDGITDSDTLRILITSNSTSYFVYRGQAMGFEYELLEAFADAHDLELETTVVRDPVALFRRLNEGEGDLAAARLVPIPEHERAVRFTRPLYQTRPVLVQTDTTRTDGGDSAALASAEERGTFFPERVEVAARLIRTPRELEDDTVFLRRGSEYYSRIVEIEDSVTGEVELVEVASVSAEEPLIGLVNEGRVRLTVAPENLASLSKEQFRNIVVKPTLAPPEPVAWAVRRNAPELQERLDRWISEQEDGLMAILYRKYFLDRARYRERAESGLLAQGGGSLSQFDSLFQTHAEEIGWDWRLLASQAYQESAFDPRARSWAGAQGLLQLMPATAREVGVSNPLDISQNVSGAVRYLSWLTGQWVDEIPDEAQRLRFILASYNAGAGHVQDARRLAEKYGDDPNDWNDVAYWMLQKSKRKYYTDPVVRYGYVRGTEPVNYVSEILERFRHYREAVF